MTNQELALQKIIAFFENFKTNNSYEENNLNHEIKIGEFVFTVRELTWKEGLMIDAKSFRTSNDHVYFSGEFEKREVLNIAIVKLEFDNNILTDEILSSVDHHIIDKLWVEYQKYLHLSTEEISFYYNCANKYFDPDNNDFYPVPPIVIEVDYMTKGILSLNKNEFDSMTMKEFETMQLILSVKNESKS
jgi:hypothetical protein